jgi:hypothetical protein
LFFGGHGGILSALVSGAGVVEPEGRGGKWLIWWGK